MAEKFALNETGMLAVRLGAEQLQKIVAADIALGLDDNFVFYTADNCTSPSVFLYSV